MQLFWSDSRSSKGGKGIQLPDNSFINSKSSNTIVLHILHNALSSVPRVVCIVSQKNVEGTWLDCVRLWFV